MGYIVDLAKYQLDSLIAWDIFHRYVDFIFARVQYGSTKPDPEYTKHVASAKKFKVPFHTYAFPAFVSVADARVEAKDAATRQDKESLSLAIDLETEYYKGQPAGITKLSSDVRLSGIKAYVDELRKQGVKKVGAYVANNVYKSWGIDSIANIFDYVWIPRYPIADNGTPKGARPDYPCDLWQYSSKGHIPGYPKELDLSLLTGRKPLSYFTGVVTVRKSKSLVSAPKKPSSKVSTVLQKGDRGDAVLQMQKRLSQAYFYPDKGAKNNGCDSDFGAKTEDAVKRFQATHGLTVDGIYSTSTKAALDKVLAEETAIKNKKIVVKVKKTTKAVVSKVTKGKAPSSYYITYTVKKGDTLSAIGNSHKVHYQDIMKATGLKKDVIFPGMKLKIPAKTRPSYIVKAGDSLWSIGQVSGVPVSTLKSLNKLKSDTIKAGQKLYLK